MSLKILLADDSMTAQNMGKKILQDAGYEVTAVSNGAAALKKINAGQFDLLLLDVVMPGYTGPEVCAKARDLKGYGKTPILFTIGKMEMGVFKLEDAPKLKGDGVIIKPFEASDLITAVQKITGGAPAKAVPTVPPEAEKTTRITPITEDTDQSFAQWSATAERHREEGMEATPAPVPAPVEMPAGSAETAAFEEAAAAPAFEAPVAAPAFDLSTPAYETQVPEAPAFGSPENAPIPLETAAPPAGPLDFGLETTPELAHVGPVAPAPGLELTAAEPVHVHIETAPELEIHSRDDRTPVSADPNFESDRTRMVNDFATKFSGVGEEVAVGVASAETLAEAAPMEAAPEVAIAPELGLPEIAVAPSTEETARLTPWVTGEAPVFAKSPEPGKIVSFAPPEQLAEFLSRPVDEPAAEEVHAELAPPAPEPVPEPAVVEAAPTAVAQELEQAITSVPEEPAPAVEVAPPPATLEASLEQSLQPEAAAPVEAQPEPVAEPEPPKPPHDLEFAQALEAAISNAPEAPAEPHHEEAVPQEQAKAAAASALADAVAHATPAEAPAAEAAAIPGLEGVDPKIIAHAIERVLANAKSQILEEVMKELKK